jgi:hypothetical protein
MRLVWMISMRMRMRMSGRMKQTQREVDESRVAWECVR